MAATNMCTKVEIKS